MDAGPEKIVYILGGGHSGSTLLDLILGSTDVSFSVGELMFLDFYMGHKIEKVGKLVRGRLCTCEEQFDDCPFWSNLQLSGTDNVPKHESLGESLRILFNILNPLERWFQLRFCIGANREVYGSIFAEASKSKPNLRFIVDSSKDPRRLYELVQDPDIGPDKLAVIHLVRDGRGYIYSYQKPERLEGGRKLRNTFVCLVEWIAVNLLAQRLLRKYKLNAFTMSYDRFAENPAQSLAELGNSLGYDLDSDNVMQRIENTEYHNVHGNPIRRSKISVIKRDVKWMSFFSPVKRWILSAILYPFNRNWVYPRS